MDVSEIPNAKDVQEHVKKNGFSGIDKFLKQRLEKWKNVTITMAVTGHSGVGKSSLINAIMGVPVAKTGVKETTRVPTEYTHPQNEKIKLWDLPGLGTPNNPDLEAYCAKLEEYDTFLILSAGRFGKNDLQIAEKVKSINKSFFFVRTKIDQDVNNNWRDNGKDKESTLSEIREDCWENLSSVAASKKNVFLISNHQKDKWDFPGLRQAILDALEPQQRESLILSLTNDTKDVMKLKVKTLRDRIWMVAGASAAVAAIPVPGLSMTFDVGLVMNEIALYKSQLGIPDENSPEFQGMTSEEKANILKYCVTTAEQLGRLLKAYATSFVAEEFARFIPFVGSVIAGAISFGSIFCFLYKCLNELAEAAFNFLEKIMNGAADK